MPPETVGGYVCACVGANLSMCALMWTEVGKGKGKKKNKKTKQPLTRNVSHCRRILFSE